MKCINATFNTIDDAEFAISTLKNEFEFSYSYVGDSYDGHDSEHDNDSFVLANLYNYNNSNFLSPMPMPIFTPYPASADSINFNSEISENTSDVIVRIKCRDAFSNEIKNRLINLNGRHIKMV